jgi:hypothetical protein
MSGKPLTLGELKGFTIDPALWKQLENYPQLPRDNPQLVARFALGFRSP